MRLLLIPSDHGDQHGVETTGLAARVGARLPERRLPATKYRLPATKRRRFLTQYGFVYCVQAQVRFFLEVANTLTSPVSSFFRDGPACRSRRSIIKTPCISSRGLGAMKEREELGCICNRVFN